MPHTKICLSCNKELEIDRFELHSKFSYTRFKDCKDCRKRSIKEKRLAEKSEDEKFRHF